MQSKEERERKRAELALLISIAGILRADVQRSSLWKSLKIARDIKLPLLRTEPRVLRPVLRLHEKRTYYKLRYIHTGLIIFTLYIVGFNIVPLVFDPYAPTMISALLVIVAMGLLLSDLYWLHLIRAGRGISDRSLVENYIVVARDLLRQYNLSLPQPIRLHHNDYAGLIYRKVNNHYEARLEP